MPTHWTDDQPAIERAIPLVITESLRVCRGYIWVFNEDQKVPALCQGCASDTVTITDNCLAWYAFSNAAVFIHALSERHQEKQDEIIALTQRVSASINQTLNNGLSAHASEGFNTSKLLAGRILFRSLSVNVPIEDDVLQGYEYALRKCAGTPSTIEALLQRFQRHAFRVNALATVNAAARVLR